MIPDFVETPEICLQALIELQVTLCFVYLKPAFWIKIFISSANPTTTRKKERMKMNLGPGWKSAE